MSWLNIFGRQMITAREDAEKVRQEAVVLSHRLFGIAQDVIAKPRDNKL